MQKVKSVIVFAVLVVIKTMANNWLLCIVIPIFLYAGWYIPAGVCFGGFISEVINTVRDMNPKAYEIGKVVRWQTRLNKYKYGFIKALYFMEGAFWADVEDLEGTRYCVKVKRLKKHYHAKGGAV
jgi:hypothetical protein